MRQGAHSGAFIGAGPYHTRLTLVSALVLVLMLVLALARDRTLRALRLRT